MKSMAAARWRTLIGAQEKSGQSVREFATERGINAATLYWWRSRLRQRDAALVPVTVIDRANRTETPDTASGAFELELGEVLLRIPAGFAESDLRRVLQALRC